MAPTEGRSASTEAERATTTTARERQSRLRRSAILPCALVNEDKGGGAAGCRRGARARENPAEGHGRGGEARAGGNCDTVGRTATNRAAVRRKQHRKTYFSGVLVRQCRVGCQKLTAAERRSSRLLREERRVISTFGSVSPPLSLSLTLSFALLSSFSMRVFALLLVLAHAAVSFVAAYRNGSDHLVGKR